MKPRIGLITLVDPRQEFYERALRLGLDIKALNEEMHEKVRETLTKESIDIVEDQFISNKNDAEQIVKGILKRNIELLILHVPGWTFPVFGVVAAREANKHDVPSLVLATSAISGPTALKGALDEVGLINKVLYGDITEPEVIKQICVFARVASTKMRLSGQTLGIFGGRSMGMYTAIGDPSQIQKMFGVDIEHIDQIEIVREAEKVSPELVNVYMEWLKRNVKEIRYDGDILTKEKLEKQVRCYIATKEIAKRLDISFIGIKCQPELSDGYINQCLTAMLSNDPYDADGSKEPIVCACEADMNGALTMQILKMLSGGKPVLFMDLIDYDKKRKIVTCMNCGGASTWYASRSIQPEANLKNIELLPNVQGKAGGACASYVCAPAEVITWARLSRINGKYVMFIIKGKLITDVKMRFPLTWPTAHVAVDVNPLQILSIYDSQHAHIVVGDYTDHLIRFCELAGIKPILFTGD